MITEKQEELLARYREVWAELNAALAVRADIDTRVRELKEKQRSLANQIAALGDPDHREGKGATIRLGRSAISEHSHYHIDMEAHDGWVAHSHQVRSDHLGVEYAQTRGGRT